MIVLCLFVSRRFASPSEPNEGLYSQACQASTKRKRLLLKQFYRFVDFWKCISAKNCSISKLDIARTLRKNIRQRKKGITEIPAKKIKRNQSDVMKPKRQNLRSNMTQMLQKKTISGTSNLTSEIVFGSGAENHFNFAEDTIQETKEALKVQIYSQSQISSESRLLDKKERLSDGEDSDTPHHRPESKLVSTLSGRSSFNVEKAIEDLRTLRQIDFDVGVLDHSCIRYYEDFKTKFNMFQHLTNSTGKNHKQMKLRFSAEIFKLNYENHHRDSHKNLVCLKCIWRSFKKFKLSEADVKTLTEQEEDILDLLKRESRIHAQFILQRICNLISSNLFEIVVTSLIFSGLVFSNLSCLFLFGLGFFLELFKYFFLSKNSHDSPDSAPVKCLRVLLKFAMGLLLFFILFKFCFFISVRISPNIFGRYSLPRVFCSIPNPEPPAKIKSIAVTKSSSVIDFENLTSVFRNLKKIYQDLVDVNNDGEDVHNDQESPEEKRQRLLQIQAQEKRICTQKYLIWFSMYDATDDDDLSQLKQLARTPEATLPENLDQYDNFVSRFFTMIAKFISGYIHIEEPVAPEKLTRLTLREQQVPVKSNRSLAESDELFQIKSIKRRSTNTRINHYWVELFCDCLFFLLLGWLYAKNLRPSLEIFQEPSRLEQSPESLLPDPPRKFEPLKHYFFSYFSTCYFILMILIGMVGNITPNTSNIISLLYVFVGLFFLIYNQLINCEKKMRYLSRA